MTTIDALADRYWDAALAADPLGASLLGDHRAAHAVPDVCAETEAARVAELRELAAQADALDPTTLDEEGMISRAVLIEECIAQADHLAAGHVTHEVAAALVGPIVELHEAAPSVTPPDAAVAAATVERYRAVGTWLAAASERLAEGVAAGRTPPILAVEASVRQIDGLLAQSPDRDPLLTPVAPPDLDPSAVRRWREDLTAAVRDVVRPALLAYREHLVRVVAPVARVPERSGLCWIPDGAASYAAAIRRFTSLELDPQALHAIGLEEVAALDVEYAAVGRRALGTAEVETIFARLRDDPELRFATAAQVRAAAQGALARAQDAVPGWFATLPSTPCVVEDMAAHEVADGTIAYYLPPAEDGSRPGTYRVNTHLPQTRTRFESEALAFHESVPGHHLQVALAQELDLHPFRRNLLVNSYVEGWALYTERLADEMGLYSGDVARLGMLSMDSWRACRLVVDTGLHHLGWSRRRAIDYLLAHSPQAENNIVNEVDRYIVWPGQALGYKVGQRTITGLRARAERELAGRFDVRAFHGEVLGHGALPLGVLDEIVGRWISAG